jgi:NitT/TauT family transport system ATP-binding protein
LGRHLQLEIDDLFPLIEAADLLDFADTQEGDLVLTAQGQRFAEADVLEEKEIFREQVLTHIAILGRIVHALQTAPGHSLPEEYFKSQLEEHFGENEAKEQLETAINWGRYAELFSFNEDRGLLRLEEPETAATK